MKAKSLPLFGCFCLQPLRYLSRKHETKLNPPNEFIRQELSMLENQLTVLIREKAGIIRELKRATTETKFLKAEPFKATPATEYLARFKFGHSEEEAMGLGEGVLYADLLREMRSAVEGRIITTKSMISRLKESFDSEKENIMRLR